MERVLGPVAGTTVGNEGTKAAEVKKFPFGQEGGTREVIAKAEVTPAGRTEVELKSEVATAPNSLGLLPVEYSKAKATFVGTRAQAREIRVDTEPPTIIVGDFVQTGSRSGWARYVGSVGGQQGEQWVGIEYEDPREGNGSSRNGPSSSSGSAGLYNGQWYFACPEGYGDFVPIREVRVANTKSILRRREHELNRLAALSAHQHGRYYEDILQHSLEAAVVNLSTDQCGEGESVETRNLQVLLKHANSTVNNTANGTVNNTANSTDIGSQKGTSRERSVADVSSAISVAMIDIVLLAADGGKADVDADAAGNDSRDDGDNGDSGNSAIKGRWEDAVIVMLQLHKSSALILQHEGLEKLPVAIVSVLHSMLHAEPIEKTEIGPTIGATADTPLHQRCTSPATDFRRREVERGHVVGACAKLVQHLAAHSTRALNRKAIDASWTQQCLLMICSIFESCVAPQIISKHESCVAPEAVYFLSEALLELSWSAQQACSSTSMEALFKGRVWRTCVQVTSPVRIEQTI
jgi:hypothetical protein